MGDARSRVEQQAVVEYIRYRIPEARSDAFVDAYRGAAVPLDDSERADLHASAAALRAVIDAVTTTGE